MRPKRGTYWYFAPPHWGRFIVQQAVIALAMMWFCHETPGPYDTWLVCLTMVAALLPASLPLMAVVHWRLTVWRYLRRRRQGLR